MSIPTAFGKNLILSLVTALLLVTMASAQQINLSSTQKAQTLLQKNLRATGLSQAAIHEYIVTNSYTDKKTGHLLVYLQQAYLGIPVYNKIGMYIFKNDSLVDQRPDYIPKMDSKAGRQAAPVINGVQAIQRAGSLLSIPVPQNWRSVERDDAHQHFVFDAAGFSLHNLSSNLVWLPVNDGRELKLSWTVRIGSADGNEEWLASIDAQTGELLQKKSLILQEHLYRDAHTRLAPAPAIPAGKSIQHNLPLAPSPPAVNSSTYRVYPFPMESANYGSRTAVSNPWTMAGAGNDAATLGWHFDNTTNFTYTRGNNVWAQQDLSGALNTTGFSDTSLTSIPALTFDQPLDTAGNPTAYANIRAGIDNLFYWNNLMHDISYQYGFDEAAGNFQADNLGRGGAGNDYVHAFSQDGGGTNNADFYSGPDGENPRMRMFLWNSEVTPHFHVSSPSPADYTVAEGVLSSRNRLADVGPVTAAIVLVNDVSGSTHQACGSIQNAVSLVGKIALVDRGGSSCPFTLKVKNAQNAGAIGVIVVSNVAGAPTVMSGNDTTITIPAVMVSQADGNTIKAGLPAVTGTLAATGHYIDGALDNGVIAHEYTHGISNRLTAGPSNAGCLLNWEQMGEGWSDYMALMVTTDWNNTTIADNTKKRTLGTYVSGQQPAQGGIRRFPYTTDIAVNPWTYDSLATATNGEPHSVGEIWCATLWDMTWNIIATEGIDADLFHGTKGNNIALQLVMQGLKYQPCGPGFLDGRDAILKADSILYNYAHKCAIWNAFARRGMGKSALQGSAENYTDQTPAKDLPSGISISQVANKSTVSHGSDITYTIHASCNCQAMNNISVVDTLSANLGYLSSTGGVYTAPYVHFDGLNFTPGETKTFTIQAQANGFYSRPDTLINDTRDPAAYAWSNSAIGNYFWTEATTKSHSSSHAWYAYDQPATGQQFLTSGNLLPDTLSTLSFWHYYDTDPSYDGGVVEITTDGGTHWQDLGPYMTQNAYNSNIPPFPTETASRKAFSGNSGGQFIQTIIPLTGFAGTTAKIRFRFGSDALDGGDGWYIDDIFLKNEKAAYSVANVFSGTTLLSNMRAVSAFAASALPVNFLDFEAKRQSKTVLLQWTVNGEISVNSYTIEKSADGNTFTSIGTVPASAPGTTEKNYSFTDNQPLAGDNYYRVAEKDIDGKITYSAVRAVAFSGSGLVIKLSPIPSFNHQVKLDVAASGNGVVTASLLNTLGQQLQAFSIRRGVNWLSLDGISKGVYFLRIETGNGQAAIGKLVIE